MGFRALVDEPLSRRGEGFCRLGQGRLSSGAKSLRNWYGEKWRKQAARLSSVGKIRRTLTG
jgi:hypothetical protein